MYKKYNFNYANINKSAFEAEFNKSTAYYGNVVMWTTMFLLPLYFLLDYFFLSSEWVDLILIRLIGFGLSYLVYTQFKNNSWNLSKTLTWFIAFNILTQAFICAIVPASNAFPYFVLLGLYVLIVSNTVFLEPKKIILIVLASFLIIWILFSFKNLHNKYELMFSNGGGVYIAFAAIACFLAYTRFGVLWKRAEHNTVNVASDSIKSDITSINQHTITKAVNVETFIDKPKDTVIESFETKVQDVVQDVVKDVEVDATKLLVNNDELNQIKVELPNIENIDSPQIQNIVDDNKSVFNEISDKIATNTESLVEEAKNDLPVTEFIAPAIATATPVIATLLNQETPNADFIVSDTKVIDPIESQPKSAKSIHEEIEDTIRLLRGEKSKHEITPVQEFVGIFKEGDQEKTTQELNDISEKELDIASTPLASETNITDNLLNTRVDNIETINNNQLVESNLLVNETLEVKDSKEIVEVVENELIAPISSTYSDVVTPVVEAEASNVELKETVNVVANSSTKVEVTEPRAQKNTQRFNLNELVETNIIDLIDSIHLKDQSIQLNISPAANTVILEKNKINSVLNKIIEHIIRYSPSGSIITCNAERINDKAVVELTSHATAESGEKLKVIRQDIVEKGSLATNLANEVGLGNLKEEIENIGGSFYYNHTNDNSNYIKLELSSTQ